MKLIIASNNKHKIYEIKTILKDRFDGILSLGEAGIAHETVEDGETFLENAEKKAREIAEISGCAALADDSGICADALGGKPGVYSARFAGAHGDDLANNRLLVQMLKDKEDKSAHYTAAIVICFPNGEKISAEGHMYGSIIDTPRGERGFGYDPHFVPLGESRTVAEMSDEEKNAISHRGEALRKIVELLDKRGY